MYLICFISTNLLGCRARKNAPQGVSRPERRAGLDMGLEKSLSHWPAAKNVLPVASAFSKSLRQPTVNILSLLTSALS
jgi:hypothetical protein